MRYRYAFASSGWGTVDSSYAEPVGILKGAKPTWQDTTTQSKVTPQTIAGHAFLPLAQCYSRHPVLTTLFNGLAFLSILAIIAHVFIGITTIHPLVLLFIALSSVSLSLVLSAAVEEFYDEKEKR